MKTKLLLFISLVLLFNIACKKKDKTNPIIATNENTLNWTLQDYYKIPTATANDNENGDISSDITINHDIMVFYGEKSLSADNTHYILSNKLNNVNEGYIGKAGSYTVIYTVSDNAGNTSEKNIIVNVKNSMEHMSRSGTGIYIDYKNKREKTEGNLGIGGIYSIGNYEEEYDYTANIIIGLETDDTINNLMYISKVANITGLKLAIYFDSLNTITLPTQMMIANECVDTSLVNYEDFLYIISQNGTCQYDSTSFFITYQVERYRECDYPDFDYEWPNGSGYYWNFDIKATYKETYIIDN